MKKWMEPWDDDTRSEWTQGKRKQRPTHVPRRAQGLLFLWSTLLGLCACQSQADRSGDATRHTLREERTSERDATYLGSVTSASPEATEAGLAILRAGGNAVDAAVAVAFALGVSEPAGSGMGGQAILLVREPGQNPIVINGTTRAPKVLPESRTKADFTGIRATTVPSMPRVLNLAQQEYGSGHVTWKACLEPAIRAAREGTPYGVFRERSLNRYRKGLERDEQARQVFLESEGPVVREALARTLERLATAGARDFYEGALAQEIAADMKARGGLLTAEDLATFPDPAVVPALHGTYRGHDVYTLPPPAGGWVLLLGLNILEQVPSATLQEGRDERLPWLAEALRAAHATRVQEPVENLRRYASGVERRIDKDFAKRLVQAEFPKGGGETTHFCVADAQGLVVSVSLSLNSYFGSKVVHPTLGFFYNDYMREFDFEDRDDPFFLEPGNLPYSSMCATLVMNKGEPVLAVGSPGSRRIISATLQVISRVVDEEMDVESAVAAARVHVLPEDDTLMLEQRTVGSNVLHDLERRGFEVSIPLSSLASKGGNPYFGGVHALAHRDGQWSGAADPRRDGTAKHAHGKVEAGKQGPR